MTKNFSVNCLGFYRFVLYFYSFFIEKIFKYFSVYSSFDINVF